MILRALGLLIGLAYIFVAPSIYSDINGLWDLLVFLGSCAAMSGFIAYGIGGQKLLTKLIPAWAEQDET